MRKVRGIGLGLIILGALAVGGCFLFPNRPPVAEFAIVYNTVADEPLLVVLDASTSNDPDGDEIILYMWTFGEDVDIITPLDFTKAVAVPIITVKYPVEGEYTVTLMVRDKRGKNSTQVSDQVLVPSEELGPTV